MLIFSLLFSLFSVAMSMHFHVDHNQNLVIQVANICAANITVDRMLERIGSLEDFEAVPAIIHCKSVEVCKLLLKKSTTYTSANKKAWDLGVVIDQIYDARCCRTIEETPGKEIQRLCLCEISASGWDALKRSEKDLCESNLFSAISRFTLTSLRKEFPAEFDAFGEATIKVIDFGGIINPNSFTKEYERNIDCLMFLTQFTDQMFDRLLGPVLDIDYLFEGLGENWLEKALVLGRPSLAFVAYNRGMKLSKLRNIPLSISRNTLDKFSELIATPRVMDRCVILTGLIKMDHNCSLFCLPGEILFFEIVLKLIQIEKESIRSALPELPEPRKVKF